MEHKRIKVEDGINLTVITDKRYKTNVTSVSFIAGEGERAAACSALLTGVLSRSCRKYPSLIEINRALDDLYDAQLNADSRQYGLSQVPVFKISSLNNRYSLDKTDITGGCLDILYSIIADPCLVSGAFDEKVFESEKQQLISAVNSIINNRSNYALCRCTDELMAYEPRFSQRFGSLKTIRELTPADVLDFYYDVIKNAPVNIVFVSSEDDPRIYEFAEKTAGKLGKRGDGVATGAEFRQPGKRMKRKTEKMPITQDVLCVGCALDGDYRDGLGAERALYGEIFSQNPTSRLFENVREKLSLCYYCSSIPLLDLKKMIIYAGVDGKNRKKAEAEILKQTELMKNGVSADELERCRLSLKNDILSLCDSPSRTAAWYASRDLHGLELYSPYEFSASLDQVTPDGVVRVAKGITPYFTYVLEGDSDVEN